MRRSLSSPLLAYLVLTSPWCPGHDSQLADPSFEETKPRDKFGLVFAEWAGWKYEGECEFRVGSIARSGKSSCLLFGGATPKIRIYGVQKALEPGRYRIRAYIRGLDIGTGAWNMTTEFAFNGKYMQLKKNGTFGWTPLTYVVDVTEKKDVNGPSFGLMAPGYLWIDDVTMTRVATDAPLTEAPVLGEEEAPIAPPGTLGQGVMRCPECGYRNMPAWKTCYACGEDLASEARSPAGPPVRMLTSFETDAPFTGGTVVREHTTHGAMALRLGKGYAAWDGVQDWSGYDYLAADLYTDAAEPVKLYVEIRDKQTSGYWTRLNHSTVVPPGGSTLILPLGQLYVGEKSRPGRNLILTAITRLVFSIGDTPTHPLYIDNIRLERDVETSRKLFDGLWAFDFGKGQSPLMPGFTRIAPSSLYSKGRGYGLKDAKIWRTYDVLQPDPLYQDFICIEGGGLSVDVPNGKYHVFVNVDSPSGYWGEYQKYRRRAILAEGREVVHDTMDLDTFRKKYFRFWKTEDSPRENTFDKYQTAYFDEKEFDVDIEDGRLDLEFKGENWACCVSTVILYPIDGSARGAAFVKYTEERRRFFFDNYFRRVLHEPTGDSVSPTPEDKANGYILFTRDYMQDVYYNDTPARDEINAAVEAFGFPGEYEPLTLSILPLQDLGRTEVAVSDLVGPGTITGDSIDVGYVSYRISRKAMDGSVYTIRPRQLMPLNNVDARNGVTRRFWLTVKVPEGTPAGHYTGTITVTPESGRRATVPMAFRVCSGTLDELDLPVGPWGHTIDLPWYPDDPAVKNWNESMARKSLKLLRDYGFTSFSGLPRLRYRGMKEGKPVIDYAAGDAQMRMARDAGFRMPVVSYTRLTGLNLYYQDTAAMTKAGFDDYSAFIKAIFSDVQSHAEANDWLPVYWNLGDEPVGDNLKRAAENAEAYRKAFPTGPPYFTAATSFHTGSEGDGHFRLGKAVHIGNFNKHNAQSVRMIRDAGSDWAFYNGGNRWTYGIYMYKAARQFGMIFRLSWHWNVVAGDPYYALDCREDDYAWCNSSPDGALVHSLHFERQMREGIDDYRTMLTLDRLAEERNDAAARNLIDQRLAAFELGQRNHGDLFPASDWREFRRRMAEAIERLRE